MAITEPVRGARVPGDPSDSSPIAREGDLGGRTVVVIIREMLPQFTNEEATFFAGMAALDAFEIAILDPLPEATFTKVLYHVLLATESLRMAALDTSALRRTVAAASFLTFSYYTLNLS